MSRDGLHRNLGVPAGGFHTERIREKRVSCDWCGKRQVARALHRDIMDGPDGPLRCRDAKACAKRARRKKK